MSFFSSFDVDYTECKPNTSNLDNFGSMQCFNLALSEGVRIVVREALSEGVRIVV